LLYRLLPWRKKCDPWQAGIPEEQGVGGAIPDDREERDAGAPLTGKPAGSAEFAGRHVRLPEQQHDSRGDQHRGHRRQAEADHPAED
jgi:hypothetical protein